MENSCKSVNESGIQKVSGLGTLWIRRAEDDPTQLEELCIAEERSPITVSRLKNLIVNAKLFRNVNYNSDIVSILHGGVALDHRAVVTALPDLSADSIFVLSLKDDKFSGRAVTTSSSSTTVATSTRSASTPVPIDKASDSAAKPNVSVKSGSATPDVKPEAKPEIAAGNGTFLDRIISVLTLSEPFEVIRKNVYDKVTGELLDQDVEILVRDKQV